MSGRGYAERNLPSFFANSFGTLDHFKVDCKAEELTQGQHLVISVMDTGLEKDSQASNVLRVHYEPPTSSTSEVRFLSFSWNWQVAITICNSYRLQINNGDNYSYILQ